MITKGEWKVCNCNGTYMPTADIHILGAGSTEEEQCIATLSYHHKDDAQLISASPDLYEALKELIARDDYGSIRLPTQARDVMLKALAKSEGL